MDRLYELCIGRMATLTGVNTSTVLAINAYVRLCRNLSIDLYSTRQAKGVLDFAEIFPLDFAVPLLGFASPIVIIITIILNTCVVKVLTSKKLRSPTNVILVAIAVLDMVTGVLRLPWYIYTYSLHGYTHLPDQFWCYSYYYLFRVTPIMIHTASLWSTVLLAFQRYVGISQLRRIGCICQYRGLIGCFTGLGIFSFIIHSFQLTLVKLDSTTVMSNDFINIDGTVAKANTCSIAYRDKDFRMYFSQYYVWTRLILAQILPCVLLAIFNTLLLRITFRGYRYRRKLVRGNKLAQNREMRTTLRMSIMLILITGSTLLAETLVAINLVIIQTTQSNMTDFIMEPSAISKSMVVSNFFILVTFPLNFLFYFSMSSRFRRHFVICFVQRKRRRIVPLLKPSRKLCGGAGAGAGDEHGGDDDDDNDDDDEDRPEAMSPVQMNNLQLGHFHVSKSNYSSSHCM